MSEYEDVAAAADLAEGEMLGVTLNDGEPVCLFRHDGTIGAVSDLCTHAMYHISDGVLHPDGTLECIWHGARYDCRTGAVKRHPAQWALPVFAVRIENERVLIGPQVVAADGNVS